MSTQPKGEAISEKSSVNPASSSVEALAPGPGSVSFDLEFERRRISYFMLFRLVLLALITLLSGLSTWVRDSEASGSLDLLTWSSLALAYSLTAFFAYALRYDRKLGQLAAIQSISDLVLTSIAVTLSGGIDSGFAFLYLITILGAALMGARRLIGSIGIGCIVVYLALVLIQFLGWLPYSPTTSLDWKVLWLPATRNVAAMTAVTILASHLNTQLLSSKRHFGSLRRLHADILRSLNSGLLTLTPDGLLIFANATAREILGLSGEISGRPCESILPGLHPHLLRSREALHRFEMTVTRPDLPSIDLGLSSCPLLDESNQFIGYVLNFQDVTKLRELERKYRRNERLAAIGSLASSVAHEVRNPLAAISGSADLIADAPLTDEDRRLLEIIRRESARLDRTVRELLTFTRPKTPEAVPLDLKRALEDILESFRADPANEKVTLELISQSQDEKYFALVDPSQFSQIQWNLLRNAVEAMDGEGTLRLELSRNQKMICLEIDDSGPGIPAELRDRVFEPFFSTKSSGSGIGLALVHRIIQDHEGTIDIRSSKLGGSRFLIELPSAVL